MTCLVPVRFQHTKCFLSVSPPPSGYPLCYTLSSPHCSDKDIFKIWRFWKVSSDLLKVVLLWHHWEIDRWFKYLANKISLYFILKYDLWGRFPKWRKAAAISSLLWLPLEMKLLKELRENINQPRHTRSGEILTSSCLSIPPLSCSRFKRHLVFFPVIISSSEPLYQLSIHLWPSPQPPDVLELHARKKETGEGGGKPH